MTDHPAISGLQQLGWSELEARLYVTLQAVEDPQTGYQCAKLADIPRPNAYPALQRLVRRGAVVEVPGPGPIRYQTVAFTALQRTLRQAFHDTLASVTMHLAEHTPPPHVAVARGAGALRQQAQDLIHGARVRLDVGASVGTVESVQDVLDRAVDRRVAVTFYCFDGCPPPGCGRCRAPRPVRDSPLERHGWLTLLSDDHWVLMASDVMHDPQVLTTDLPPLVNALRMLFRRVDTSPSP
ncbi:MAG: TrmB family transcriptional regulator [Clostridia bacterium]